MKSPHVRGIVAYEPGSGFPFPEGEAPAPIVNNSFFGPLKAVTVSRKVFERLTHYPIVIYYGDFIPKTVSQNPHADYWRAAVLMARQWVAVVNQHGGSARVVELPDLGIRGNSHFPFAEKNSAEVEQVLADWLHEQKLDVKSRLAVH